MKHGEGFEPWRKRDGRGGKLFLEIMRGRGGHTASAVGPAFLSSSEAETTVLKGGKKDGVGLFATKTWWPPHRRTAVVLRVNSW